MVFMRKILNWYARLSPGHGRVTPPYQHVVQIGDPVLRRISQPVPLDKIKTEEIQNILKNLEYIIKKYQCLGMSAPQIGINYNIFAMRLTSKQLSDTRKYEIKEKNITVVPYTVFINPILKVVDYNKITHLEGCESVRGFSAEVARYKQVEVTGFDATGEKISEKYSDWTARIAQHEMDHLEGLLYTDIMDRKTLTCSCWQEVNLSQGKVVIPLSP